MFRKILSTALKVAGNQENLAHQIGCTPSALSKRINGDCGWFESDIEKLMEIAALCIECKKAHQKQITALTESLRVVLETKEDTV